MELQMTLAQSSWISLFSHASDLIVLLYLAWRSHLEVDVEAENADHLRMYNFNKLILLIGPELFRSVSPALVYFPTG